MDTKKILGQRLMKHTIKNNLFPALQYSTNKNKAVLEIVVKRLYFDMIRITKVSGLVTSNDLLG